MIFTVSFLVLLNTRRFGGGQVAAALALGDDGDARERARQDRADAAAERPRGAWAHGAIRARLRQVRGGMAARGRAVARACAERSRRAVLLSATRDEAAQRR